MKYNKTINASFYQLNDFNNKQSVEHMYNGV